MKKKFVLFMLALLMLIFSFAAVGCDSSSKTGGGKLAFGTKYIYAGYINGEETNKEYYVFNSDGTCEYTRYREYSSGEIIDYTIKFIYTYADKDKEGIYCFFDSITFAGDEQKGTAFDGTDLTKTFAVSDNVLMSSTGVLYVNEDYAAKYLKNFNKKAE